MRIPKGKPSRSRSKPTKKNPADRIAVFAGGLTIWFLSAHDVAGPMLLGWPLMVWFTTRCLIHRQVSIARGRALRTARRDGAPVTVAPPRKRVGESIADRCYAVEHSICALLERLNVAGERFVNYYGSPIELEKEQVFYSLAGVQAYVDFVLGLPSVKANFPNAGPVKVKPCGSERHAYYHDGGLYIHPGANWQLREMTIIHELSHHFSIAEETEPSGHGNHFRQVYVFMVRQTLGHNVSVVLEDAFSKEFGD